MPTCRLHTKRGRRQLCYRWKSSHCTGQAATVLYWHSRKFIQRSGATTVRPIYRHGVKKDTILPLWAGMALSVYRPATGWTVRGSNPGEGEIFRTLPDLPWGPPSLLCNRYRVSFPRVKRPGRGANHPPSSSAEVKERVELYLYSPSGLS
jgi:hypothetical protein